MSLNQFLSTLESIGLTKSEANLYLESLKMGPASAIQLAQKTGVTRQMIYTLLPNLIEKGLMKQTRIEEKRLFQALNPDVLADRVSQISQQVQDIIPQLKSKQAESSAIPLISVYENPLSMREWYRQTESTMQKGEEMLIWSSGTFWYGLDAEFYKRFAQEKTRKGVIDKVLCPNTAESKSIARELASATKEFRFLSQWWMTGAEMWIWRDQLVYLTIKENATNLIIVESEALTALERFKFMGFWKR